MTQVAGAPDEVEEQGGRKPLEFPTAFTVLGAVLLVVWVLSFAIPSGTYQVDAETGGPKPGTYAELPSCGDVESSVLCSDKSIPHQFYKLWNARTNGLYGIQNEAGNVSVDNVGFLYGSAQIFLFVLAIGAFHQRHDEDGGDPGGHQPAGAAVPSQPGGPDRRADGRVRARRNPPRGCGRVRSGSSRCSSHWRSRWASTA